MIIWCFISLATLFQSNRDFGSVLCIEGYSHEYIPPPVPYSVKRQIFPITKSLIDLSRKRRSNGLGMQIWSWPLVFAYALNTCFVLWVLFYNAFVYRRSTWCIFHLNLSTWGIFVVAVCCFVMSLWLSDYADAQHFLHDRLAPVSSV